ncbi:TIGR00730 family Rossman fold protein [Myxococcota bacterium]|nr:TIGR00730 family Rossman fold protein [Myxococcota bacterium]
MKSLCVFLGARSGHRPEYAEAARALGEEMARRGLHLVYGGGGIGLMGTLADAALAAGGRVTGVIPDFLADQDVAHRGLTELRVVASMHERKAAMAEFADGFVMLPGGLGTLEECFEVLTWGQLGVHGKPCGVLNVSGYWTSLLAFLDQAVEEGFVGANDRAALIVESTSVDLLDRLQIKHLEGR